jgi:hypothetical protein
MRMGINSHPHSEAPSTSSGQASAEESDEVALSAAEGPPRHN